jgi:hypothetical protein
MQEMKHLLAFQMGGKQTEPPPIVGVCLSGLEESLVDHTPRTGPAEGRRAWMIQWRQS